MHDIVSIFCISIKTWFDPLVNTEILNFDLLVPVCQINIWTANCERAAAVIFDWRLGVFKEVQFFVAEKVKPQGPLEPSTPCQMFYQDQTLFTLCVLILAN